MFRPRRYGYGGNRGRHDRLPLVLLAGQVLRIGIEHIPPATLGLFAVNTAFHLLPYELGLPSIAQGCLRPDIIMVSLASASQININTAAGEWRLATAALVVAAARLRLASLLQHDVLAL